MLRQNYTLEATQPAQRAAHPLTHNSNTHNKKHLRHCFVGTYFRTHFTSLFCLASSKQVAYCAANLCQQSQTKMTFVYISQSKLHYATNSHKILFTFTQIFNFLDFYMFIYIYTDNMVVACAIVPRQNGTACTGRNSIAKCQMTGWWLL